MKYNISYFVLGISIMAIGVLAVVPKIDVSSQFNAAANIGSNKTALMSVDTNLDECIKALDSGNTTLASEHCKMADQALESYLGKQNSSSSGS
jgi:uncharacterized protein (DUF2147 family)